MFNKHKFKMKLSKNNLKIKYPKNILSCSKFDYFKKITLKMFLCKIDSLAIHFWYKKKKKNK